MSHCLNLLLTEIGGRCYHPRDMRTKNLYLVWLNWPIGAFRLNARSLSVLKRLLPAGARLVVARGERAFLRTLPEATHAICWEFDTSWFARAPRLRVLATPAAGRELLPSDAELPPGVTRVNGAFHGQIMCETVLACIFAHARGLYHAYDFQRAGTLWPRAEMSPFCSRVAGTHAVILGYGRIGHTIGARLEALGVTVTGFRRRNIKDLRPALRTADWLVVVLPADTGTDNLVDRRTLAALPRRAVLVNVGRGNAVDETALADALRRRRLAGAYLDVFKREPLTEDSPLAADLPGLVRLPHMSAFAPEYLPLFFQELADGGWLK